jgi:SAM-dependent methyltransferase
VVACDISPRMAALARELGADVRVHDMRALPALGTFDLVTILNDAINYLLEPEELTATLRGVAANLATGGVVVFDGNSLKTLSGIFSGLQAWPEPDRVVIWRGTPASRDAREGDLVTAEVEVLTRGDEGWEREAGVHAQRHHPERAVRAALAAAGLRLARVGGMPPGVEVRDAFEERADLKAVYVAVRDA